MKKTFIATLMIMVIASASIFALTPSDSFNVKTTINEIALMQVTQAVLAANSTSFPSGGKLVDYVVLGDETVKNIGWLSTISNNRVGYTVKMTATAMESTNTTGAKTYINYTVGCDAVATPANVITTNNATASPEVLVLDVGAQSVITSSSKPITFTINSTNFTQAVTGDYLGTVTFNFASK